MHESKDNISSFHKCYAKHLGGCNSKSKEHYISDSILGTIGKFEISGVPWIPAGTAKGVPASSLTANILCKKHNSDLSEYDSTANKLVSHLKVLDSKKTSKELKTVQSTYEIDGVKLEKWFLKTLCGAIASGNYHINGKSYGKLIVPQYLVELLFSPTPWRPGVGLYIQLRDNAEFNAFEGIAYNLISTTNENNLIIYGIDVSLWGFEFRCLFATDENGISLERYRPKGINIINDSIKRKINFIWPSNSNTSPSINLIRKAPV